MEREKLKSRLGFILISAGCAIGIGNVWKFAYMAGQGGGGFFVLLYLLFLVMLGIPIMSMEFAVGRASQKETEFKDKLFQEVAALVEAYKKTPEYVQVIKKQIIDAKSFAKNDDIIIYLDPADASKKHDLEEETKCTLTMSEYSFGGGMRAVIPARSILIDNSMDSRIAEVRNEFQFDGGEYDGR